MNPYVLVTQLHLEFEALDPEMQQSMLPVTAASLFGYLAEARAVVGDEEAGRVHAALTLYCASLLPMFLMPFASGQSHETIQTALEAMFRTSEELLSSLELHWKIDESTIPDPQDPKFIPFALELYEEAIELAPNIDPRLWAALTVDYGKLLLLLANMGLPVLDTAKARLSFAARTFRSMGQCEVAEEIDALLERFPQPTSDASDRACRNLFVQSRSVLLAYQAGEVQLDLRSMMGCQLAYQTATGMAVTFTQGVRHDRHRQVTSHTAFLTMQAFGDLELPETGERWISQAEREYARLLQMDSLEIEAKSLTIAGDIIDAALEVDEPRTAVAMSVGLVQFANAVVGFQQDHAGQLCQFLINVCKRLNLQDPEREESQVALHLFVPFIASHLQQKFKDRTPALLCLLQSEAIRMTDGFATADAAVQALFSYESGFSALTLSSPERCLISDNLITIEEWVGEDLADASSVTRHIFNCLVWGNVAGLTSAVRGMEDLLDFAVVRLREAADINRQAQSSNELPVLNALMAALAGSERRVAEKRVLFQQVVRRAYEILPAGMPDTDLRALYHAVLGPDAPWPPLKDDIIRGPITSGVTPPPTGIKAFMAEVVKLIEEIHRATYRSYNEIIYSTIRIQLYLTGLTKLHAAGKLDTEDKRIYRRLLVESADMMGHLIDAFGDKHIPSKEADGEGEPTSVRPSDFRVDLLRISLKLAQEMEEDSYVIVDLLTEIGRVLSGRNETPADASTAKMYLDKAVELTDELPFRTSEQHARYYRARACWLLARWRRPEASAAKRMKNWLEGGSQLKHAAEAHEHLQLAWLDLQQVLKTAEHLHNHEMTAQGAFLASRVAGTLGIIGQETRLAMLAVREFDELRLYSGDVSERRRFALLAAEAANHVVQTAFSTCDAAMVVLGLEAMRGRLLSEALVLRAREVPGHGPSELQSLRQAFGELMSSLQQVSMLGRREGVASEKKSETAYDLYGAVDVVADHIRQAQMADASFRFGARLSGITELAELAAKSSSYLIWLGLSTDAVILAAVSPTGQAAARKLRWAIESVSPLLFEGRNSMPGVNQDLELLGAISLSAGPSLRDLLELEQGALPRVVLIPDAFSAHLPLAALRVGTNGESLADIAEVSILPSATILREIASNVSASRHTSEVFVQAAPQDRPLMLLELAEAMHRKRGVITDHDTATIPSLLRAASCSQTLIFGGHAHFDADSPLSSHLLLGSDQRLSALDILQLETGMSNDLVYLGSCYSASVNAADPLQEVFGIHTALNVAGVRCVVGAVRPITDSLAFFYEGRFFEALDSGKTVFEAVRTAALWVRDATRDEKLERAQRWLPVEFTRMSCPAWRKIVSLTLDFQEDDAWASFVAVGDASLRFVR